MPSDQPDKVEREPTEKDLERAIQLYSFAVRDYFSTFAAYTTSTSILVATLGFAARDGRSTLLTAVLASLGILLCLQWHLSTCSMRDQYRYFYSRIIAFERSLGVAPLMSRWRDAASAARPGRAVGGQRPDRAGQDASYLTWSFRQIDKPWAPRGAGLPVIYSCVFLAVLLSASTRLLPLAVAACVVGWLCLGGCLVYVEQRTVSGRKLRPPRAGPT